MRKRNLFVLAMLGGAAGYCLKELNPKLAGDVENFVGDVGDAVKNTDLYQNVKGKAEELSDAIKERLTPDEDERPVVRFTNDISSPIRPEDGVNNNALVFCSDKKKRKKALIDPNLMQQAASFIVIDKKEEGYEAEETYLMHNGYVVKHCVLGTDLPLSMQYNPFAYIKDEGDVAELANAVLSVDTVLTAFTTALVPPDKSFVDSARFLLSACALYVQNKMKDKASVAKMLGLFPVVVTEDTFEVNAEAFYELFKSLDKDAAGLKYYEKFCSEAGQQMEAVFLYVYEKLKKFCECCSGKDSLELEKLQEKKTALYLHCGTSKENEDVYEACVNLMLKQYISLLRNKITTALPLEIFWNDPVGSFGKYTTSIATDLFRLKHWDASIMMFFEEPSDLIAFPEWETVVKVCSNLLVIPGDDETSQLATEFLSNTLNIPPFWDVIEDNECLLVSINQGNEVAYKDKQCNETIE